MKNYVIAAIVIIIIIGGVLWYKGKNNVTPVDNGVTPTETPIPTDANGNPIDTSSATVNSTTTINSTTTNNYPAAQ